MFLLDILAAVYYSKMAKLQKKNRSEFLYLQKLVNEVFRKYSSHIALSARIILVPQSRGTKN